MGNFRETCATASRNELHEMVTLVKAWLASPLDLIVLYLAAFAEDDDGKDEELAQVVEAG